MIRRYSASADNTIVNSFKPDLITRATGANCGLADVLEVYSIYGRQYTGSQELRHLKPFLKILFWWQIPWEAPGKRELV